MGMIGDITQLMFGLQDRKKGLSMEKEAGDRPQFEIPESVQAMMNLYRQSAQSGMPGYDMAKGDIQASTARTAGVAGQLADSPVAALTALGGAQDRELGALRDLNRRASEYQAMSQRNLAQAYGQKAGYETEQWRQNQLLPWEISMNRAMGLQSSGAGNIMGGITGIEDKITDMGAAAAQMAMGMPPTAMMGDGQGQGQQPGYPTPPQGGYYDYTPPPSQGPQYSTYS